MTDIGNDPERAITAGLPEVEAFHADRTPAQQPTDEQTHEIATRARDIAEQLGAKIPERQPISGREIVYQAHGDTDPSLLDPRELARRLGVDIEEVLDPEIVAEG